MSESSKNSSESSNNSSEFPQNFEKLSELQRAKIIAQNRNTDWKKNLYERSELCGTYSGLLASKSLTSDQLGTINRQKLLNRLKTLGDILKRSKFFCNG